MSTGAPRIASSGFAQDTLLAPVTLVVGKGGVGKTTVAAALAARFAGEQRRTLVVTTDPAGTLLTALDRPLDRTTHPVPIGEHLDAWAFDTAALRDAFLARWREPISTILDRGTYLDPEDIAGLVEAALPGADEIFAMLTLGDVLARQGADAYDRVVVDTAPTGHTLRLLALPRSFDALVRLLDAMQEKHRFMVRALTHRYRRDAADALIAELRDRVDRLQAILTDPARCTALLVTRPEPVVIAETERYAAALKAAGITVAATIVNVAGAAASAVVPVGGAGVYFVPWLENPREILLAISSRAPAVDGAVHGAPSGPAGGARAPATPDAWTILQRGASTSVTIVGGKGGVGKTTTSIALAIRQADLGRRTLIVSTDPAPSIADALDIPIGDADTGVLPNLIARQIDATGAFAAFRDEYRGRIDELFEGLAGRGVDVAHDREIIRDLLALAPPGIDELYALTVLGEEIERGRFEAIIIDPAPTGHLLRLLDMPRLAVAWAHQLMRMMLKYREVIGLGDAAGELLLFAKRTRALDERFHDPARASVVVVALDEPLVREESFRLVGELASRDLPVTAIIWNRGTAETQPLPTGASIPQLFAPALSPPPVGADAIRHWSERWGSLRTGAH